MGDKSCWGGVADDVVDKSTFHNNDDADADDNDQNDGGHGGRGRWEAFLQRRSNCHQREIIVGGAPTPISSPLQDCGKQPKITKKMFTIDDPGAEAILNDFDCNPEN